MSRPKVRVVWNEDKSCSGCCVFTAIGRNGNLICNLSANAEGFQFCTPGPNCPGPGVYVLVPEEELKRLITKGGES